MHPLSAASHASPLCTRAPPHSWSSACFQVLVSSQGVKKSDTSRGKRSSVAALDVNANNHRAHLRRVAKHAQNDRKKFRRVELRRLVLLLPVDAGLWATGFWRLVPYLRLTRFFFALPHVALLLDNSERSQAMPFALTRSLRVIFIFCTIAHWLGCLFFMFSVATDAEYYVDAPWVKSTVRANGRTDVRCSLPLEPWAGVLKTLPPDGASSSRRTRCQALTHTFAAFTGASRPSRPRAMPTSSMSRPKLRRTGRYSRQ